MSKKNTPRKRKIGAVSDEELMPPPQAPVSKRYKTIKQTVIQQNVSAITDISNISNSSSGGGGVSGGGGGKQQRQNKCGPLSIIFEKVQENEALHTKYYKELTNLYGKVNVFVFGSYSTTRSNFTHFSSYGSCRHNRWTMPYSCVSFCVAFAFG